MRSIRPYLVLVLILYWVAIFAATHLPPANLPRVNVNDKIEHFLAYALLSTLLFLTLWSYRPEFRHAWLAVIVVAMCYGAADEWLQLLVGRDCELNDWLTDVSAAIVVAIILSALRKILWHRALGRQRDAWKIREALKQRVAE
jgi:VanZ family protein